jgi:hypothetical protein
VFKNGFIPLTKTNVMNAKQINKSRMFGATILVLDNNLALFEAMPELAAAHQQLKEKMTLIDQHRQIQEVNNTGLTKNKRLLREELTTLILRFSAALAASAATKNDVVLITKVNYTLSDLKKSSDRILCDIAVMINGLAAPATADLQKYFVGPDELAKFDRLTNDFKSAIPLKRVATNVSKVSTGNINDIYHEIDSLLKNKVDLLIKPFRFTQPDFFNAYKNGRTLVNYSGRGKAVVTNV